VTILFERSELKARDQEERLDGGMTSAERPVARDGGLGGRGICRISRRPEVEDETKELAMAGPPSPSGVVAEEVRGPAIPGRFLFRVGGSEMSPRFSREEGD